MATPGSGSARNTVASLVSSHTAKLASQQVAPTGEIYAIYQEEDTAGTGVGWMLFSFALQDLYSCGYQSAVLWVLNSNDRARRFYERAGFQADGGKKTESRSGHVLHETRYRGDILAGPKS